MLFVNFQRKTPSYFSCILQRDHPINLLNMLTKYLLQQAVLKVATVLVHYIGDVTEFPHTVLPNDADVSNEAVVTNLTSSSRKE